MIAKCKVKNGLDPLLPNREVSNITKPYHKSHQRQIYSNNKFLIRHRFLHSNSHQVSTEQNQLRLEAKVLFLNPEVDHQEGEVRIGTFRKMICLERWRLINNTIKMMSSQLILIKELRVRSERLRQISQQNGYQMIFQRNVDYVKVTLTYLEENIIVGIVESKHKILLKIHYSLVCHYCSSHFEYAVGYADKKVRVCDACYRDIKRFEKIKKRRDSIISCYFSSNAY